MSYEKWSLGYWFIKQYVRFINWVILKRTIVTGKDKIPKNKPIVFAPNHQNALNDPLAVLLNTDLQPVWLARADIFGRNKVTDAILRFFKIVPVFRLRDGKENLEKNQETFATSLKVLKNNAALALFPEAAHTFKRQMAPHKKAVPRIVFMADEEGIGDDIQIIPVGIYYSHYWKFNRLMIVNFGDPIPVADYLPLYRENPNAATIKLKKQIHDSLLPLVINIKSKKHYETFERIRILFSNHFLSKQNKKATPLNRFHSDQQLVKLLDNHEKKVPHDLKEIEHLTDHYYNLIYSLKLRPWLLDETSHKLGKLIMNVVILLIGVPLFLFGFLLNAIPFFLIDRFVKKKVKDPAFRSSFYLGAGLIVFPLYYLLLMLILLPFSFSIWLKAALIISLPLAGKAAFNWYIILRKTIGMNRLLFLKYFRRHVYKQLIETRQRLFKNLDILLFSKTLED